MSEKRDTRVKQNFHDESIQKLNKHINFEFHSHQIYKSMATYFYRDDVSLPGMGKYFTETAIIHYERSRDLIKYMDKRGGRVEFNAIKEPEKEDWDGGLPAFETALSLEKTVNESLLDIYKTADDHKDGHLADYLQSKHLDAQVKLINQLSHYITRLKRVLNSGGLGEYLFDHHLYYGKTGGSSELSSAGGLPSIATHIPHHHH